MTTQTSESGPQNRLSRKIKSKYLLTGSVIAILIASTPFIFYLYRSFPEGAIWETSFFTYESIYFESVSTFVWMIFGKLIPLVLLLIWFFTCRHWWYLVILIPIAMYTFQLISLVNDDVQYYDEIEIYLVTPIIIVILGVLYTIRLKIFDKIHGIDLSELQKTEKKSWWNRFRK